MDPVTKVFSFPSGRTARVELADGVLSFTLTTSRGALRLTAEDLVRPDRWTIRCAEAMPGPGTFRLLSGRVSAEETADSLTLHTNPVDSDTGAPVTVLPVHYRVEAAGESALAISTWFGCREPMCKETLRWMALRTQAGDFTRLTAFDPDLTAAADAYSHLVRFGAAGLSGEKGFVCLSGCGGTFVTPGGTELSACCGNFSCPDLSTLTRERPLRAVLSFGEGEPVLPRVKAFPAVPAAAPEGERCALRSGRLEQAVRVRRHGVSLESLDLGSFSTLPAAGAQPLTVLTLRSLADKKDFVFTSEHDWERVSVFAGAKTLRVRLEHPRGIPLSVVAEARAAAEDTIEWHVRVLNSSPDWSVLCVTYPGVNFRGGPVSVFLPEDSGRVFPNAGERQLRWDGSFPSGFRGVVPVLAAYDPALRRGSGVYAAIHAPEAARTDLTACAWPNGEGAFSFLYPAEAMGMPANSFSLPGSLTVSVLDGDWYDAALRYGAWLETHARRYPPLGREDTPDWMKKLALFVMDWMPNDNPDADPTPVSVRPDTEPDRGNWVTAPAKLADRLGLPIGYHLYNWHFIPFNNDYPRYFPVKEGLEAGVKELKRHGVHVFPYVNARIADTRDARGESERFERDYLGGATKNLEGEPDLETYASHEPDGSLCTLAAVCPTWPAWRRTLREIVWRLREEYGTSGVYLDQIAAARQNLCCDRSHPHLPGNGAWWTEAYRNLMEELRESAGEGFGFMTESNAENYADCMDGFLTWAWIKPDLVPFFPRLYAGRVLLLGRNTNGYKKSDALYFRWHTAQAVIFGQTPGWTNADVVYVPEKIDFLCRACRLRADTLAYYDTGRMLRPPEIAGGERFLTDSAMGDPTMAPAKAVVAGLWQGADGSVLLTAANAAAGESEVTLSWRPEEFTPAGAGELTPYGDAELLEAGAGFARLRLGGMSCAALRFGRGRKESE